MPLSETNQRYKMLFKLAVIGSGLIVVFELLFNFQLTSVLLHCIKPNFPFMALDSVLLERGFYPIQQKGQRDDILVAALGYKRQPIYADSHIFVSSMKVALLSETLEQRLCAEYKCEVLVIEGSQIAKRCVKLHAAPFQVVCPITGRAAIVSYSGSSEDFARFQWQLIRLVDQLEKS